MKSFHDGRNELGELNTAGANERCPKQRLNGVTEEGGDVDCPPYVCTTYSTHKPSIKYR